MRLIWIAILFVSIGIAPQLLSESISHASYPVLEINNPEPELHDFFGISVASASDGKIIVGSSGDNSGVFDSGSVYVFDGANGTLLKEIRNPDQDDLDKFGNSVASASDGKIIVGATHDDTSGPNAGSVYVFHSTGYLLFELNNPAPNETKYFGDSIYVTSDDNLLISSLGNNSGTGGVVYLFDGSTGELLLEINDPLLEGNGHFGTSIAVTPQNNLLISSLGNNSGTGGVVYLFDGSTGDLLLEINNPEPGDPIRDNFGSVVATLSNHDVVVGAPLDDTGSDNAGSVYLFDGSTGDLLLEINNPEPEESFRFGSSLHVTPDDNILIYSSYHPSEINHAGSVYLFDGSTGDLLLEINNPEPEEGTQFFGSSLSVSHDGKILVGYADDSRYETYSGSVFLYRDPTYEKTPSNPTPFSIGQVQWSDATYSVSDIGVVRVVDPDMDLAPNIVDKFGISVWSDSDAGGIDITVVETGDATGIFEGNVFFTTAAESSGNRLEVSEGDTITSEYRDNTLPDTYTTADGLDIVATSVIGADIPLLHYSPAANLRLVDEFRNSLDVISSDQQVYVTSDLSNGKNAEQPYTYLVQIADDNGIVVSLKSTTGVLSSGQSFSPALSWTPASPGTYVATVFIWESMNSPSALSPPLSRTITVD